jgi:hypothetical protein
LNLKVRFMDASLLGFVAEGDDVLQFHLAVLRRALSMKKVHAPGTAVHYAAACRAPADDRRSALRYDGPFGGSAAPSRDKLHDRAGTV